MIEIFEIIEKNKERLSNSSLHKVLVSKDINAKDKLRCIPAMTFFVMGFKDTMQLIRVKNPKSKIEEMINTHSDEDNFHWEWFLNDLKHLNPNFVQQEPTKVLAEIYQDSYMPVRDTVYTLMGYIKQYKNPIFRILVLETVENGYEIFTRDMSPVIKEIGLYNTLEYFGQKHNQAEEGHEMDHLTDEEYSLERLINSLSSEELKDLKLMVQDIYDHIYAMHECFASSINML